METVENTNTESQHIDITVVVPLYNEEESLPELYAWIERVMKANNFTFEVIFVNDGSTDIPIFLLITQKSIMIRL